MSDRLIEKDKQLLSISFKALNLAIPVTCSLDGLIQRVSLKSGVWPFFKQLISQ